MLDIRGRLYVFAIRLARAQTSRYEPCVCLCLGLCVRVDLRADTRPYVGS